MKDDDPLDIGNILDDSDPQPGPNDIIFTQYFRPHGRPGRVWVTRPSSVVEQARALTKQGYVFEVEELMDKTVSMTVEPREKQDDDLPIAIELCPNGPDLPAAVDRLIRTAFARVCR